MSGWVCLLPAPLPPPHPLSHSLSLPDRRCSHLPLLLPPPPSPPPTALAATCITTYRPQRAVRGPPAALPPSLSLSVRRLYLCTRHGVHRIGDEMLPRPFYPIGHRVSLRTCVHIPSKICVKIPRSPYPSLFLPSTLSLAPPLPTFAISVRQCSFQPCHPWLALLWLLRSAIAMPGGRTSDKARGQRMRKWRQFVGRKKEEEKKMVRARYVN